MSERLQMIEQMLETNPHDSFLHYCAALEHQKKGDAAQAIKILKAITSSEPDYLASYYQLGKLLEEKGKTDEAIVYYKTGKEVAKKKKDSKTFGELSEALMLLDVYED
ncbi:MAG: tetratricopeptide repeat protein [Flavobacteriales bacterium]|nr:tetratricopeptide repeat protein [Flavobacteriales bacterium]